jgi:hypothetical protein
MLANEMFIDSAIKRSSVVSLAKHLGYTPRSITGAKAFLNITVNNPTGLPTSLTLDRYTAFSTNINGTAYTFLTTEPYTIQPVNGIYTFTNIPVKEGTLLEYSYTVSTPGPDEKYEIPNTAVDISTVLVTVQNSTSDTAITTYTRSNDLTDIDGTSTVYFLEENALGKYQLYFGDDVLGKKLAVGNIVRIRYMISSGAVANVSGLISQSFAAGSTIGGSSNISITTVSNSTGGSDRESISSIRFNAIQTNTSRNRAVTKSDYASIIKAQYSQVESVSVWGGEENDPPAYGKVFISLKPYNGFTIDSATKNDIRNTVLYERQVLTVIPEFVDPDYIYLNLGVDAQYYRNQTSLNAVQVTNLLRTAVNNYFTNSLQQFNKPFFYSKFLEELNSVDSSIASVLLTIKAQKRLLPILNVSNAYVDNSKLNFNNKLHPDSLVSTRFNIINNNTVQPVRIKDVPDSSLTGSERYNGIGDVRLYHADDGTDYGSIGSINYATGEVSITNITPVGYPTGQFDLIITCGVQEDSYNITTSRNQIIALDDSTESTVSNRLPGLIIKVTAV